MKDRDLLKLLHGTAPRRPDPAFVAGLSARMRAELETARPVPASWWGRNRLAFANVALLAVLIVGSLTRAVPSPSSAGPASVPEPASFASAREVYPAGRLALLARLQHPLHARAWEASLMQDAPSSDGLTPRPQGRKDDGKIHRLHSA